MTGASDTPGLRYHLEKFWDGRMNWDAVGAIGEIIGATAVIRMTIQRL
jgi:hypothetical protein